MPWLCTTIAGSMPIFCASCSAAPSALGPGGTGRVNDSWTMPSPVVSPYGLITVPSGMDRLQQLQRRVVGVGSQQDDAVQALAAVRRALGDAEGAVGDRLDEPLGVVGDPAEEVDGLAQHAVGPAVYEPALRRGEVLGQSPGGLQDVAHVAQREVAVGEPGGDDGLGH